MSIREIIPQGTIPDSRAYRLGRFILQNNEWDAVEEQDDGQLWYLSGYASINLNYDLVWLAYPDYTARLASGCDKQFVEKLTALPRWNRTRWLVTETINGGPVNLMMFDYKANKPVSPTCRGIKKIDRLIKSGQLKLAWHGPGERDWCKDE
jgi:hypothetical protein